MQLTSGLAPGVLFFTRYDLSHFFAGFTVQEYPTNFDHLGRILGYIYTMFIACGRYMSDNVAIQLGRGRGRIGTRGVCHLD